MRKFAVLSMFAWSATALAAGFEYPDNGTIGLGRGGAFAARADDGTAIYYNPSGLADQDGWRVLVDAAIVNQSLNYQRTDADGAVIGPPVTNTGGAFFAPFVAVSKQLLPGLTVAIGVYGPPANGNLSFPNETPPQLSSLSQAQQETFPSQCGLSIAKPSCLGAGTSSSNTAPQKYQLISQNLLVAYPTVSVAWAPTFLAKMVAIGGSLQLEYVNAQFRQATYDGDVAEWGSSPNPTYVHSATNELLTYDTIANVAVNGLTVTGILGATVKPLPNLRIGASYRPESTLTMNGTLRLDYSPLAQSQGTTMSGKGTSNAPDGNLAAGSGPATLTTTFPGELKSGVDYDFGFGDVELDFNYTQWSQYQQSVLTPGFTENTTSAGSGPIPAVDIIHNFRDTWALRLGAEFRIPVPVVRLAVRAGGGYESSAYDPSRTQFVSLGFANFEQFNGAVGATVGWQWLDLDLAYSHVYMPEDDVRNSGVQAVQNIPPTPPSGFQQATGSSAMIVGNGNYKSSYDLIALGLRAHF